MSTYRFQAKRISNGEMVTGTAHDDHFGRHQYGYEIDGQEGLMKQKTFDKKFQMIADHMPEAEGDTKEKEYSDDPRTRTFLLTDACLWEKNRQEGTFHPHAIEVVDIETGQVRYIESGAKIQFVEGKISDNRNQEIYNKYGSKTGE